MNPLAASSALLPAAAPATLGDHAELHRAAKGFEAIFVRRMLEAARAADFGGDDVFGGAAMEQYTAMRDDQLADIAAERGTFGIAAAIEAQLANRLPSGGESSGS